MPNVQLLGRVLTPIIVSCLSSAACLPFTAQSSVADDLRVPCHLSFQQASINHAVISAEWGMFMGIGRGKGLYSACSGPGCTATRTAP